MPDKNRHILQATKNEQYFQTFDLDDTPYLDWAAASLFYAALHFVDAYLANNSAPVGAQAADPAGGHHPRGHINRREKIVNDPALTPIDLPYRELRQRCDDARYRLLPISPALVKNLASNEYNTVKNHVSSLP